MKNGLSLSSQLPIPVATLRAATHNTKTSVELMQNEELKNSLVLFEVVEIVLLAGRDSATVFSSGQLETQPNSTVSALVLGATLEFEPFVEAARRQLV